MPRSNPPSGSLKRPDDLRSAAPPAGDAASPRAGSGRLERAAPPDPTLQLGRTRPATGRFKREPEPAPAADARVAPTAGPLADNVVLLVTRARASAAGVLEAASAASQVAAAAAGASPAAGAPRAAGSPADGSAIEPPDTPFPRALRRTAAELRVVTAMIEDVVRRLPRQDTVLLASVDRIRSQLEEVLDAAVAVGSVHDLGGSE